MDNLKSRGIRSFAWDLGGNTATQLTSFLLTVVLARMLEPSFFGLVAIALVLVEVAQVLTDVGLGSALIQRRKLHPSHYSSAFIFNVLIGLLLTFSTYVAAPAISEFYSNPNLRPVVEVMSVIFLFNSTCSVQLNKLVRELNYALITKCNYLALLISGATAVTLAVYGFGIWSLVALQVLRSFLFCLFLWSRSGWRPGFGLSFKALGHLWKFGFNMFLSALINTIFEKLDIIIIGKLFTASTLGFFDRAKALNRMVVAYTSGSLMRVLFPVLSSIQNDLPRFTIVVKSAYNSICFVTFFVLGGLFIVADELILILFTEKWIEAADYLKLLLLSGLVVPLSALLVNVLSSRGRSGKFLELEILKRIAFAANLYIGFHWGIEGYLIGLLGVSAIGLLLNIMYACREIKLPVFPFVKIFLLQIIVTGIPILLILNFLSMESLNPYLSLVCKGVIFAMLYIIINRVLRTSPYEYASKEVLEATAKFRNKLAK